MRNTYAWASRKCGCAHTLFTGQREREINREIKRRERERER
jgi:hypothetical protein